MKEIERFIAEEVNGKRYTVSCLQEIRKTEEGVLLPDVKHYRTSNGEFLKALDDSTFNILGSGKMIYKNKTLPSMKFNLHKQ